MSKRGCSTCTFRSHYDCAPEEPECCKENNYPFYQCITDIDITLEDSDGTESE